MADTDGATKGCNAPDDRGERAKPPFHDTLIREADERLGERIIAFRQNFAAEIEASLAAKRKSLLP